MDVHYAQPLGGNAMEQTVHTGVKLRKCLTSGPRYGCDHCGTTWKKPTEVLSMFIPDLYSTDVRTSINFCFSCAGSLSKALAELAK